MKKFLFILFLILILCLSGFALIAPVGLMFLHISSLPGLSGIFEEQLHLFSQLTLVEEDDQQEKFFNRVHSITITLTEEELDRIIYENLSAHPSSLFEITQVNTELSAEMLLITLNVRYHLFGMSVFETTISSEWMLRVSPAFSASPMPGLVEIKPVDIRAAYFVSINWVKFWDVVFREKSLDGWTPLPSMSSFCIEDIDLQDNECMITLAPSS